MTDNYRDEMREALGRALDLLGELMSYDNYYAYPPNLTERVEEFVAPYDAEGLDAALSRLSAQDETAGDARELDFDFFWQIVLEWSRDMPRVGQKLSIHEMRTLTERLLSITQARLSAQDETAGDAPWNARDTEALRVNAEQKRKIAELEARLSASGQGERSCETCSAPNGAECTRRNCSGAPAFDRWEPAAQPAPSAEELDEIRQFDRAGLAAHDAEMLRAAADEAIPALCRICEREWGQCPNCNDPCDWKTELRAAILGEGKV